MAVVAYPRGVRTTWMVVGLLLAVAGLIWTLQGFNVSFAPKSFMTGDGLWIVLGVLTLIAGLALAAWSWQRA
jgi:hypothetical protein